MRLLAALPLLAAAGCVTAPSPRNGWLVGHWCAENRSTTYAGVSGVGLSPTRFEADGTYRTFEEVGRWELKGPRLIRTYPFMRGTFRANDRVERLGPDLMAWTWDSGRRELWRRCPPDRQ